MFVELVTHASATNVAITTNELSPELDSAMISLQWAVSATEIRENGYIKVRDFLFFSELLYISLTGRSAAEMTEDVAMALLEVNDPQKARDMWRNLVIPLVSDSTDNPKLIKMLTQFTAAIVLHTPIDTAKACFDRKRADMLQKIWNTGRSYAN